MPSIKEIKDELKELGITKGLSKMTKSQLEDVLNKANKPHEINSKEDRKNLLRQITRKDLLEVISKIRIKNYSHLNHNDLIELIAESHWFDFHTKWKKFQEVYLHYSRPFGYKPTPKPKIKKEPKKSEMKEEEEEKYVDEWNLENAKSTIDKLHLLPSFQRKKYMMFLLNRFQGNLKFYKQNKTIIDKFTTPTQRKRLSFLPNVFI
jgi:hypothetical protein